MDCIKHDRRCSNFLKQVQKGNFSSETQSRQSKIIPISPSKQMLESSNSKHNPFSSTVNKLTFMNTRPMFLGPRTCQPSSVEGRMENMSRLQTRNRNKKALTSQHSGLGSKAVSQERLESFEDREAIYESHGIMASADKNILLAPPSSTEKGKENKRNSSGTRRHHSISEKITFPAEIIKELPAPLTARNAPSSINCASNMASF